VDWNVRFADMLSVAWQHVREGGYFVATFRLTADEGCDDFARSYQFINYEGRREGELAAYVVLNAHRLADDLLAFNPASIDGYGYWGAPSATAVTPYEQLCFAAFAVRKRTRGDASRCELKLELPARIIDASGWAAD
jgi:hypothetical protein